MSIAFNIVHNTGKLLSPTHYNPQPEEFTKSGVYALTCNQCKKRYIGQTGRSFYTRYKEHAQDYRQNYRKSQFAKYLLEENHILDPTEKNYEHLALHQERKNAEHCRKILHTQGDKLRQPTQ
jgi:hypothetical protein